MRAFELVAAAASILVVAGTAVAQRPAAVPPLNVMLPNDNGVPVGEIASLEAGAFLARADDSSSAWYNPAGLSGAEQTSISGSAAGDLEEEVET